MHIIKDKKDIQKVFRLGNFSSSGILYVKFNPNKLDYARIAISIGLKFSKKATERNRTKRILRHAIQKNYEKIKSGYDLVFYLKNAEPKDVKFRIINESIENILIKNKLIKLIKRKIKSEKLKSKT